MAPKTTTPTQITTNLNRPCRIVPLEVPVTADQLPNLNTIPPAEGRVSQRVPLWVITNPHTPQAMTWLIIGWERRGELLSAQVIAEDQDMTTLRTWPLYIQDGDLFSTVPALWTPQAPPVRWAYDTDGEPRFQVITGWAWCNGLLKPITTTYDAEDLERLGIGLPVWTCKDTDGEWLEGYARGWHWAMGQLVPECFVENAESLDMWDNIIRPTLKTLEV